MGLTNLNREMSGSPGSQASHSLALLVFSTPRQIMAMVAPDIGTVSCGGSAASHRTRIRKEKRAYTKACINPALAFGKSRCKWSGAGILAWDLQSFRSWMYDINPQPQQPGELQWQGCGKGLALTTFANDAFASFSGTWEPCEVDWETAVHTITTYDINSQPQQPGELQLHGCGSGTWEACEVDWESTVHTITEDEISEEPFPRRSSSVNRHGNHALHNVCSESSEDKSARHVSGCVAKYKATHLNAASPIPSLGLSAETVPIQNIYNGSHLLIDCKGRTSMQRADETSLPREDETSEQHTGSESVVPPTEDSGIPKVILQYLEKYDNTVLSACQEYAAAAAEDTGNSSTNDQTLPQADVFSAQWWSQLLNASPISPVGLSAEPVSIQNIYTGSEAVDHQDPDSCSDISDTSFPIDGRFGVTVENIKNYQHSYGSVNLNVLLRRMRNGGLWRGS